MNKLLAIYVGQDSQTNLRVGLDKGIWGFKDRSKPDNENLGPGDYIILGSGYNGGSPRTGQEQWQKHSLAEATLGRITSPIEQSTDPVWPDEPDMAESERYVHRIHFQEIQRFSDLDLGDPATMGPALSDALRRSGCNAGRGNVVTIEDFPSFSKADRPAYPKKNGSVDLFDILKKYADENIIFHSTERDAAYSITEYEQGKFQADRLDANEPVRISPEAYESKVTDLAEHGGILPFAGFANPVALKNALVQSRSLALTPDRKNVLDVSDPGKRIELFCEILEHLKVDRSREEPKLYKPAMLACVIEAVQEGELVENKISFDWVAPRFIKKMADLGEAVGNEQAAQAFCHLKGEMIWLHAVVNPQDPMRDGREGPGAAREKVKYALIKDTFWECLQDAGNRQRAISTLQESWFSADDKPRFTSSFIREASKAMVDSGLIYPDDLLSRFTFSLLAKPFVLLTGTSGTGKTQIALTFARWLVGEDGYELIPVGADWTDNRQVLGHYNPFEKEFASTRVLDLMLKAKDSDTRPYFLILDEMNLSHVERYFADFLSAMESGDPISLHRNGDDVKTAKGATVEEQMRIPKNLFVIGTVNIDETTHMFSPKVLDRANVIEFNLTKKDLSKYMETSGTGISKPAPAPTDRGLEFVSFFNKPRSARTQASALGNKLTSAHGTIKNLFELLEGSSMEFGFRTPTEFLRYCEIARDLSGENAWEIDAICDIQILQKILPKLHGSRRRIESLLVGLASYCADGDLEFAKKYTTGKSSPSHFKLDREKLKFKESYSKLCKMIVVVQRDQFVSFIQ